MTTRRLALGAALLACLAVPAASGKIGHLYALRYGAHGNLLVPYDPVRLAATGPAIRLGHFAHAWSISPDRSRFAAAAGWRPTAGEPAAVRVVDLETARIEGTIGLPNEFRRVTATAWLGGRVLAVVSGSSTTSVYSIDPDRQVTISSIELPGGVVLGERAHDRLVLLLAPRGRIGPATLAVVDRAPRARTVRLSGILAGTTASGVGADRRTIVQRPALALSPAGRRAYVFGPDAAAAVDLRTLGVRAAPLRRVAAASKRAQGSIRTAATLPDGRVVLSGVDYGKRTLVGLWLVDPADWSRRLLDRDESWFRVAGGLVFARGRGGVGLRIVRPDGSAVELFRTGSPATVTVVGPRALVTFFGTNQSAAVLELGSGRVVRRAVPANLLVERGQPIVG